MSFKSARQRRYVMAKMTNSGVAQAFAQGREGRSGHLYTEGDTIYSYGPHFPIARIVGDKKVIFTKRGYSMTTSHHKNLVRRALQNEGYAIEESDNL